MNIKHYIRGFATVTLAAIAIGAFELSSTRDRSLTTPPARTTTYSPNSATPTYKSDSQPDSDLKDLEELEKSLDYLNTRLEFLNDDLKQLSPAELEELRPVADRKIDYTSKLVGALREGSVEDRQRRLDEVINSYVCSLSSGLILDGRNVYSDPETPRALMLMYQDNPLVPLDTLFERMGGDSYDYELKNAFEVYARGAYGLKPSPPGKETSAILSCNEESK